MGKNFQFDIMIEDVNTGVRVQNDIPSFIAEKSFTWCGHNRKTDETKCLVTVSERSAMGRRRRGSIECFGETKWKKQRTDVKTVDTDYEEVVTETETVEL